MQASSLPSLRFTIEYLRRQCCTKLGAQKLVECHGWL